MDEAAVQPGHLEPPEDELRVMLEARELELELERKRKSRTLTKFLLVSAAVTIGAILCFPATRKATGPPAPDSSEVAIVKAAIATQKAIPEELKPFNIKPEEQQAGHRDDIRFAGELLDFVRPKAPQPQPAPPPVPPTASKTPANPR